MAVSPRPNGGLALRLSFGLKDHCLAYLQGGYYKATHRAYFKAVLWNDRSSFSLSVGWLLQGHTEGLLYGWTKSVESFSMSVGRLLQDHVEDSL